MNIDEQKRYDTALERIELCYLQGEEGFSLDLNELGLRDLPPEIYGLSSLKRLELKSNQLVSLPADIGRLTSLTNLDLQSNRLASLPSEIGELQVLEELWLNNNSLSGLPVEVGRIRSMRQLHAWNNKISTIPVDICKLPRLESLDLHENHLSELPDVSGLSCLTELNLNQNKLRSIPRGIEVIYTLKQLLLHGNPLLGVSDELLGPTWRDIYFDHKKPKYPNDILDAYFRVAGEAGEVLGECKVIVVGRGGVGKTSLVKRLKQNSYNPNEQETHGIQIQPLTFSGKKGKVLGRVWDFGGQVVLHSMHEFFLTARSLYLLVLGERDDMLERDAAYWLQLIRSYAGKVPVIVVLNKSAGRQRNFDRETLEKEYGPILGWVSTECSEEDQERSGIAGLRRTITAAMDSEHMESVRRKFPRKWSHIKTEVELMSESFLSYADFQEMCRTHGEPIAKEQAVLASDLHDLGVALNYGRDARLRNTTVLRPDWLANGIYAVLRANDRDENALPPEYNRQLAPDGIITMESLKQIHNKAACWNMLDPKDYPEEKQIFLLRLMDLFHLSYPLDEGGTAQLVPTLLPPTPPEGTDEPSGENSTRLRYEFQVVPAPLLPWFIARTFSLIPKRRHWSRGTMLEYGSATGKVWMTQDERHIFATVKGDSSDRDRLLAIIRGTLHKIFHEYKALNPNEQWQHKGNWVPTATLVEFGVLPDSILPPQLSGRYEEVDTRVNIDEVV